MMTARQVEHQFRLVFYGGNEHAGTGKMADVAARALELFRPIAPFDEWRKALQDVVDHFDATRPTRPTRPTGLDPPPITRARALLAPLGGSDG